MTNKNLIFVLICALALPLFSYASDTPGLSVPHSLSRIIERAQKGEIPAQILRQKPILNFKDPHRADTVSDIANRYITEHMQIDPFWAPYFSTGDFSKLGNDLSEETRQKYVTHYKGVLEQLKLINPETLSETDRDTYELLKNESVLNIREFELPFHLISINHYNGSIRLLSHLQSAASWFPFKNLQNYEDYLARTREIPIWVDTAIAVLNEAIQKGIVLEKRHAEKTLAKLQLMDEPIFEKSLFAKPIQKFPETIGNVDQELLIQKYKYAYDNSLYPQIKRFIAFYKKTYLPQAGTKTGLAAYGETGKQMYAHRIELFADKKMSALEAHNIGLNQVKVVSQKLELIKTQLGFKGTLAEFLKAMAANENHYFKSASEMIAAFEGLRSEVNLKIPQYFNITPKADYLIQSFPENEADGQPSGAYGMPSDSQPYGIFYLNTFNLKSTPIFSVRPLSMHEASPGHHFQLAIAYEKQKELGYYRSLAGTNAFIEGWAHYAEYLANEMSLYPSTLDQLGFLSDQIFRGVRLVVDTGIHHYGWSHEKVVQYMQTYLASDMSDIESEANRYEMWPGQALGYKIGQLEILRLREKMKKQLGGKFDIREFHDRVISQGSLSLSVLGRKF